MLDPVTSTASKLVFNIDDTVVCALVQLPDPVEVSLRIAFERMIRHRVSRHGGMSAIHGSCMANTVAATLAKIKAWDLKQT